MVALMELAGKSAAGDEALKIGWCEAIYIFIIDEENLILIRSLIGIQ